MHAEINVTSLIDVAFTLLVIFIITAPILQGGLEVRLPRAQVQPVSAQDNPFIVTVMEDGTVVIGETPVTVGEFDQLFEQLYRAASPSIVYIRGDERAFYGPMYQVMATIYHVAAEDGVSVGILGEPIPGQR
jgi:biopolymer transport protein TolR